MSIDSALQRVTAINQALSNPAALVGSSTALAGGTAAPASASATASGESSFAAALETANSSYGATASPTAAATIAYPTAAQSPLSGIPGTVSATPGTLSAIPSALTGVQGAIPGSGGGEAGQRIVAAAGSQIGQTEQPPGSNESPAIAEYRSATEGASPGAPWCAYFASWAARQAGDPIGSQGQGLGSVSEIWSWAQSSGRAVTNGPSVVPKPGDLIVFGDEHVGIVKGVLPNGNIETIEGNYNNQVSANVRPAGEASGYVSMS